MVKDKHPRWLRVAQTWCIHIFWILVGVLTVWLLWANRDSFLKPTKVSNLQELTALILSIKANVQVIMVGSFFSLLGFFYVVLRIPFVDWENLKLFGFEMKKSSEIQQAAKEELSYSNEVDWLRVQTLETISSELGYAIVDSFVDGNDFDGQGAFASILEEVVDVYKKKLDLNLDFGIVRVDNGSISPSDVEGLSNIIKKLMVCTLWESKPQSLSEDRESVVVSPVFLTAQTDPQYLIFLHAKDYVFDKRDEAYLQAISNIVRVNADLALISNMASQGGMA